MKPALSHPAELEWDKPVDGEITRHSAVVTEDPLVPTVFHEPWFLNAATGGSYEEATVQSGGRFVGRLPFIRARLPAGQLLCTMPALAHFLGPAIDAGTGAPVNRALRRDGILRELIANLPPSSGFYQKLHRDTTDTLVFEEQGFRTLVQFSYDVPPSQRSALWEAMRDKTRNVIRRAEEQYTVMDVLDVPRFVSIYQANLIERGKVNHYTGIPAVCEAALRRDRGRIIAAHDTGGRIVAAIFYIWDSRAAYYFLTTRRLDSGNGAVSLLIWSAIQDTARRGLVFDFDGVATPGSRVFYSGFGGTVVPRYIVYKYSLAHRIIERVSMSLRLPPRIPVHS